VVEEEEVEVEGDDDGCEKDGNFNRNFTLP
jgi:hypothetical protein